VAFSVESWSEPIQKQAKSQSKSGKLPEQKSKNQQKPTENIITTQILVDAISRAIDAYTQKTKATQNPLPPDNSYWWFSFFLTIFTGLLVVVGGIQCYIIFNTLKETQKAANAAKESADALPTMERAYLFSKVEPSREIKIIHEGFEYDKGLEALLFVKNYGKTPAIIKEIGFYGYKFDSLPDDDNLIISYIHPPRVAFIGNTEGFVEEDRFDFTLIKEDEWVSLCFDPPKLFIYCVGYIKYTTIFNKEHCHYFCWEFDGPTGKFIVSPDNKLNYNT